MLMEVSMKKIILLFISVMLLIGGRVQAALKYDAGTVQKTTLQEKLAALDVPLNLKNMDNLGTAILSGHEMVSKHLYLCRREDEIGVDEVTGKVNAFLIVEMTELNGTYVPVIAKGKTDALIIVVKKSGYGAYHAVCETKPGEMPAYLKEKQEKKSLEAQLILNELTAVKKENGNAEKLQADYNKAVAELTEIMQEATPYLMTPRYDWKAVGKEIDMSDESNEKWIRNRMKILPKAQDAAQATVDERKNLKAQLASLR